MTTFENYLPATTGTIRIEALDAEDDESIAVIPRVSMLWDTAAHFTIVSENLLPKPFRDCINSPGYKKIYGADNGISVQISLVIQFSNTSAYFESIAIVRPSSRLPNNFSGVILGQHSLLNSLKYEITPARVLRAQGHTVEDHTWGDISIHGYVAAGQYTPL